MRFVRAAAALTALIALLGGVPWLLITTVGNPWPAEGVNLMAQLSDSAIVGLLAVLVWLLWAQFVVCVGVETVAVLRERHTDIKVPASFGLQSLARTLVSAIAIAVITVPTAASASSGGADLVDQEHAPSTPSTSQEISTNLEPAGDEGHTGTDEEAAAELEDEAAVSTVTVHRGDSLWSLATKHLGDGERYVDIAELNEGQPMNGGGTFRASAAIQPGWELQMPSDATGTAPAASPEADQYEVRPGDTLSQIALDELGDASAYPQIVEASADVVQPGGRHLSDPDHIEPGWKLNLRATAAPTAESDQEVPPADEPQDEQQTPPPAPESTPEADVAPPAEQSTPEAPAEDTAGSEAGREAVDAQPEPVEQSAQTPTVTSEQTNVDAEDDESSAADLLMSRGGIGVFLAAGLIGLLAVRRRRQQKKRRPGQRIPKPSAAASQVEYQLRSVADQQMPQLLQTMLRALASTYAATGQPLPAVRAARVSSERVELYLSTAAELPAPWTQLDDDAGSWVSEFAIGADVDVDQVPDPYPLLVTAGLDPEDAIVLVNLEDVTPFGVGGASVESLQILAAAGAEICTAPWAGDVRVSFVEGWSELAAVLPADRCRYVPSAGELEQPEGLEVLIVGDDVETDTLTRLRDAGYVLMHAGRADGWGLQVEDDHDATLLPLALSVRPQLLTTHDYQLLAEVLGTALQEPPAGPTGLTGPAETAPAPEPAAESDLSAPSEPVAAADAASPAAFATGRTATLEREATDTQRDEHEEQVDQHEHQEQDQVEVVDDHEQDQVEVLRDPISIESRQAPADRVPAFDVDELLNTGHPVLRMMPSTFSVRDARGAQTPHENLCRRIVAFMAMHPSAARQQLIETIWPNRVSDSTVKSSLSRARAWIGENPETGNRYVQGLKVDPAVRSDWEIFTSITGDDISRATSEDLEKALALVNGRPFEGEDPETWTFVDLISQDMIAGVVDAAYELAKRRFLEGRWRSVKHYASVAAMLEPVNESVWRLWIHACHASRDSHGLAETIDRMHARISHLGDDLEPETTALLSALDDDDATTIEQSRRAL